MANTYDVTVKLQAIADAIAQGGGGGGGTTVIANPTGTPTADLNTIQIGQTIYDIPGGGGGGNVYDRTVLATPNTVTPGEISLSDNINNYDDLEIVISFPGNTSKSAFRISADYFMSEFPYVSGATPSDNHLLCCLYDTYYVRLIMGSANNKMYLIETNTIYLEEIAGIKYISRGGGSDEAVDINYDNTTSGLTATNVQDAIDENASDISTLNSNMTPTTPSINIDTTNVSSGSAYCRKIGRLVILNCQGLVTPANGKRLMYNLPIPDATVPASTYIGGAVTLMNINTSGELKMLSVGTTTANYFALTICYVSAS